MKKSIYILLGLTILATISLIIYKMFTYEKYKKLREVGDFPIDFGIPKSIRTPNEDKDSHKYDGHLYKQRRRYNFLSQQNRRNQ